ncbi:Glutamate receptor 1 [Eumeta japonica]|uniref:Glutamate receptor 1 n=1 Tax=Eumeta variegata TaxID=151549 RepID=A0A4C2A933_EUMVA|nr:Glutamate receptor 1 [Eumeta japonica]
MNYDAIETDIEGLSGKISFNEEGHRHNFTLHVVEMTIQSAMVKVATWSDMLGLIPVAAKHVELHSPGSYEKNKTYIITTTLQEPYMMLKNERGQYRNNDIFFGFCKDLADYISRELAIKYEIRVVRDGKYGSESPQTKAGWNGLVGELLRKVSVRYIK